MTVFESAWEPERLSELIGSRVEVLTAIQQGRFDEAAERVDHALTEIVPSFPDLPDEPDSVVPLTQLAGLLGDAAVVEIGRGDPEAAARYLTGVADIHARLISLTEPLMLVGVDWCRHGRKTLRPNAECQFMPPCSP